MWSRKHGSVIQIPIHFVVWWESSFDQRCFYCSLHPDYWIWSDIFLYAFFADISIAGCCIVCSQCWCSHDVICVSTDHFDKGHKTCHNDITWHHTVTNWFIIQQRRTQLIQYTVVEVMTHSNDRAVWKFYWRISESACTVLYSTRVSFPSTRWNICVSKRKKSSQDETHEKTQMGIR